ncbi:MAG TPA: trypsin-like peptidase domain-containing protein [Candidatus Acidoferrum sp.]|nr:trypsin-like peptidase domain-containing protein [Candidatus Acidoferrum sp.]
MKTFWALVLALLTAAHSAVAATPATAPPMSDVRRDATVEAIERVMPSVVNIRTETVVERSDPFERLMQDFWGPYYRRRNTTETTYSLGSGMIIDEDGWVLTNFHVINRATRVFIRLADGREFEADRIVGTSFSDVALLKLKNPKSEKFRVIKFAADDDLLLGETVIALGNPFGLGGSVSKGILSSKSRRPPLENEPLEIEDWLQSDAAINPGNSGGPLVNLRGELIGVNVAVFREGQGIGFAVPVRRVSAALAEIYSPEILRSYWFGARVKPGASPLTIVSIQPDSPAAKADLQKDDQILQLNGAPPKGFIDFIRQLVEDGTNGHSSRLLVQRGKARRTVNVQLVPEKVFFNGELVQAKTGLSVDEMTADESRALGIADTRGAVVTGVERDSPAAKAGFQRGMIITAADGQTTYFEGQEAPVYVPLARVLNGKKRGDKVQFEIIVPRRSGRFVQLHQAKVEVAIR